MMKCNRRYLVILTLALIFALVLCGCNKRVQTVDGKSAYDLAVENGYTGTVEQWLASLAGEVGAAGADGKDGADGENGKSAYELAVEKGYTGTLEQWLESLIGADGIDGIDGVDGINGIDGLNGKSAYELAVENGFEGSLSQWLDSLIGADGKSAYELAVANGYTGDIQQWLASLVGADGADGADGANGKSAYELAVDNGYTGTEEQWLVSLVGQKGQDGEDGKSAYELAVENGFEGSLSQWLDSLIGADGKDGTNGIDGIDGVDGANGKSAYELAVENGYEGTLTQWLASLVGADGTDGKDGVNGKSAYELAVANGYTGDIQQWLESLIGADGADGADGANGKSAYELAVDNGYTGTEEQWLVSLVGQKGADGEDGLTPYIQNGYWFIGTENTGIRAAGTDGEDGADGANGKSAYEIYLEQNPDYTGTEKEWIEEVVAGTLLKHTVTFDLNGGTAGEGYAETVSVSHRGTISLSIPTRDGYTFLGWYTGETAVDGIFTTTSPVEKDLTLIARWQVNSFTVTFLDYYNQTLSIQTVEYGQAATAPVVDKVIGSMRFDRWSADFSAVTKDLIVRARYVENKYTVSFDTNGLAEVESGAYYPDVVPTKPADPSVDGYTFGGWYLDENYTRPYSFDYALNADTTIYAKLYSNFDGEYHIISTYADLLTITSGTSEKYVLANDIDCQGEIWSPIWYFYGELDGNGHKIYNFVISSSDYATGLICFNSGTIKNLSVDEFTINLKWSSSYTSMFLGILAGNNNGTISNCHILDGTFKIYQYSTHSGSNSWDVYVGSLAGCNSGTVENCSNATNLNIQTYGEPTSNRDGNMYTYVGGIVGYCSGTVSDCYNSASISVYTWSGHNYSYSTHYWTNAYSYVGGIVGRNNGTVQNSYSTGDISHELARENTDKSYPYSYVGGAVAVNRGTVENCYATGTISQTGTPRTSYIGGFVAVNYLIVKNCYTTCEILDNSSTGTLYAGGFVAYNEQVSGYTAVITKCFCAGSITSAVTPSGSGYFAGLTTGTETRCYYLKTAKVTVGSTVITPTTDAGEAVAASELLTVDFLGSTLYFDSSVWILTDEQYPTLR